MSEKDEKVELDPEELEAQHAEALPDREAMSIITPDLGNMPPVFLPDE